MRLLLNPPSGASALQALTLAALALPGMSLAADSVAVQISHYQEQPRDLGNGTPSLEPLEVATTSLQAEFGAAQRLRFGLTLSQDVWSGATPIATAPLVAGGNRPWHAGTVLAGASPLLNGTVLLEGNTLTPLVQDPNTVLANAPDARLVHILATASPEIRQQGSLRLTYAASEADTLSAQVGFSQEPDYEAKSLGLGIRHEFNQKHTSLQGNVAYAHSAINALLDSDAAPYLTTRDFRDQLHFDAEGQRLQGTREDLSASVGFTQILNKNAWLQASLGYSRETGLLENPYKAVTVLFVNPNTLGNTVLSADRQALLEQRPDGRNQGTLALRAAHALPTWDAALHLGYEYAQDTWGITAHTFEALWVQNLGGGWTIAPRLRYYTQAAADFYQPYLVTLQNFREPVLDALGREVWVDNQGTQYFRDAQGNLSTGSGVGVEADAVGARPQMRPFDREQLPPQFSSDHRLSGFGTLSGGLTLSKELAKGLSIQADVEYYNHAGDLQLGGDGAGDYSDFAAWNASLALKLDLDAPVAGSGAASPHVTHGSHSGAWLPAGLQFAHMLPATTEAMMGYQLHRSRNAGVMLHGSQQATDAAIVAAGCDAGGCRLAPAAMAMTMQMVELMFAPTDHVNFMLMPHFMSMDMELRDLAGRPAPVPGTHEHTGSGHRTGGLGDTVVAGLIRLAASPTQQVHLGLGLSVPTGAVDERFRRTAQTDGGLAHFEMQLGSGTWDVLPSLTFNAQHGAGFWGGQVRGVLRLGDQNNSGYRLGDAWEATLWGGVKLQDGLHLSLRGTYSAQDKMSGDFNEFNGHTGPMDFPANTGGRFWDVGIGVNALIPDGLFAGHNVRLEWLQPVRDEVNGFQLARDGSLTFAWSYTF